MKKRIGAMESDSRPIRCRPTWRMPRAAWPRSAKRKKRWSRKPKSNWKHWRKSVRPPQKKGRPRKGEAESPIGDPQLRQRTKKQAQRARKRAACPTRQYNFVDPDSRVMKDGARKCFVQAYNAQAAVDSHQQVIVAAELTQEVNDSHQLIPMVQAAEQTAGKKAETITADAGYWDTIALREPCLQGIEILVAPDRQNRKTDRPLRGVANNAEAQQMRELLASELGKAKY